VTATAAIARGRVAHLWTSAWRRLHDSQTMRHPAYVWCFLAAFVLDMFSGYSQYIGLPVSGDRLFIPAGLVLLLLDRRTERLRWQDLYVLMALLVAIALASAAAAGTISRPLAQFALLDRIAVPFLLFMVAPLVFTTPERRDLLLKTVTLIGVYLGATAIAEMFAPSLVWPRYITDPSLGIHIGRARGPFVIAETNGMALALAFFCAALVYARSTRGSLWRPGAGLAMILCAAGAGLTLTRSVWVGILLGPVLVAVVHRPARRYVAGLLIAVVLGLALAVPAVPQLAESFNSRLTQESSLYDRQNVNDAALRAVAAEPLTGIGWGRFVLGGNDWVRQADDYPLTNTSIEVHNVVLSRAAELGLPAAALTVLTYLLGPFRAALVRGRGDLRQWQLLLIASLGVLLPPLALSPNASPLPNYLIWTFAGIAARPILVRGAGQELDQDFWRAVSVPRPVRDARKLRRDPGAAAAGRDRFTRRAAGRPLGDSSHEPSPTRRHDAQTQAQAQPHRRHRGAARRPRPRLRP